MFEEDEPEVEQVVEVKRNKSTSFNKTSRQSSCNFIKQNTLLTGRSLNSSGNVHNLVDEVSRSPDFKRERFLSLEKISFKNSGMSHDSKPPNRENSRGKINNLQLNEASKLLLAAITHPSAKSYF